MIASERSFISDLQTRALVLKRQGTSAEDAGKLLGTEFKAKYADWPSMNVAGFVQRIGHLWAIAGSIALLHWTRLR